MSALPSPASSSSTGTSADAYWVDSAGTAHERCTLLFFAGKVFLGESAYDPGEHPELGWRRSGIAYYCPWCGEVWGRMVLLDSRRVQLPLDAVTVGCEKHPDQWNLAGSMLANALGGLIELMPPEAIRREFIVHMKKELSNE